MDGAGLAARSASSSARSPRPARRRAPGREVKDWGIHCTTTKAIAHRPGGARGAAARTPTRLPRSLHAEDGQAAVPAARCVDVERRTTEGFLRGARRSRASATIAAPRLRIDFQNEWIVAWRDDQPIAMSPGPDLRARQRDSGEAVGTETIRYGQRATVIALPAPPVFLTPKGLDARRPTRLRLRPRLQKRCSSAMRRIGIDVGGTNTDAVLMEDGQVACAVKRRPAGRDLRHPRRPALVAGRQARSRPGIDAVMIGTTHFINAVVQRRHLTKVAALRLGMPASASLPPFCDWPADLRGRSRAGCGWSRVATTTTAGRSCRSTPPAVRAAARR